jgi:hypothetical protein
MGGVAMLRLAIPTILCLLTFGPLAVAQGAIEKDVIKTSAGDLEITFIGHGSLMLSFGGKVADAAKAFKPKILYPYHTGETDTSKRVEWLKDSPGIEVRIRKVK